MAGGYKVEREIAEPVGVVSLYRGDACFRQAATAAHHGSGRGPQQLSASPLRHHGRIHGMVEMGMQYRDGIQLADVGLFQGIINTLLIGLDRTKKLGDADPGKVAVGEQVGGAVADQHGAGAKKGKGNLAGLDLRLSLGNGPVIP